MYNSDTLKIIGFAGSNINDVGLTSACNPSTGYLSRLAWVPINFQQGGVYACRTGIQPLYVQFGNQEQIWIDFNDDGIFQTSEEVTPVSGYSLVTTPNPILFNLTIPVGATPGIHLMRFRCIWDCHYACIGDALASHLSPCLSTYLGTAPEYWSGVVVDYLANIMSPCPYTVTATNSGPICPGTSVTLTGAVTSGTVTGYTWSGPSGFSSTLLSPVVSPAVAGVYTFTATNGSCITTLTTTVATTTPPPLPVITPATATICNGGSVMLTTAPPVPNDTIIWQNFNSGLVGTIGGTWTITNISGTVTSDWHIQTPPGYAGIAGDGTKYIEAAPDAYSSGYTNTYFTSASVSTVGFLSANLSFNYYFFQSSFWDVNAEIDYSVDGGVTWILLYNYMGTGVTGSTSWTAATPQQTIAMPAGAIGQPNLKIRWKYYSDWGFYWEVDNILLKGVPIAVALPTWTPSTYLYTNPGLTTPYITGTHTDTVYVHPTTVITPTIITYYATVTSGTCSSTDSSVITINPAVTAISGPTTICAGGTATMTDGTAWGTWSSSAPGVASISSTTGVITAGTTGTATIDYSIGGCFASTIVTVVAAPAAITGALTVCTGATTTLADVTTPGTWSSGTPSIGSISPTGVVTGNLGGTTVITYSLGSCYATANVTVNVSPNAIGGTTNVCTGFTTTLTDAVTGGSWTSAMPTIASVVSGTGVVTGVAAGVTTITYTAVGGCYAVTSFTVNSTPSPIAGLSTICQGITTPLTDALGGGTWSSTVPSVATIGAGTGSLYGVAAGTSTISYIMPTGCYRTQTETVDSLPSPITGASNVCVLASITLTDAGGGTWTSSSASTATAGPSTGVITGVTAGTDTITYTIGTGCYVTKLVTVNPIPAAITGVSPVCVNSTETVGDVTPSGYWAISSSNATINAGTGLVTGVSMGVPTISYILFATSCYVTSPLTVNPLPSTIAGITLICDSSTTNLFDALSGGTWTSGNTSICTINPVTGVAYGFGIGIDTITYTIIATGCKTTTPLTIQPPPAPIIGVPQVCLGFTTLLSDAISGGTWHSGSLPIATIDSVTGLVTAHAAGTTLITYGLGVCSTTEMITVNPLPATIGGANQVCTNGAITTLTDASLGGVWASSDTTLAHIGTSTGIVTGGVVGTVAITYTLPTGCYITEPFAVNALPLPILGVDSVCAGYTTALSDPTPGGTFTSGTPSVATVSSVYGTVTGILAGTTNITYTVTSTGCKISVPVIVNPILSISTHINAAFGDTICAGNSDMYIASSVYPGTNPVYHWTVNGSPVGGTGDTLIYSPINGDVVKCVLTSNATCAIPNNATSDLIHMVVNPVVNPTVTMTSTLGDTICVGASNSYHITSTSGGSSPIYLWTINWMPVTATSGGTAFTYTPNNGDIIRCGMISSSPCPIPDTAFAIDTIVVKGYDTPKVAILNPAGGAACQGNSFTLHANPSYGGWAPVYYWTLNGVPTGTNSPTLSYLPTNDSDVVGLTMISNYLCPIPNDSAKATVIVHVDPVIIVNVLGAPGVLLTVGGYDTFTAQVQFAGDDPVYQWYKNGIAIPGANYFKYVTNDLNDRDSISCMVTTGSGTACEGVKGYNWMVLAVAPAAVANVNSIISDIRLVPNPNAGVFTVEGFISSTNADLTYEVTNVIGQSVYKETENVIGGKVKKPISLDNSLPNGVYVLHIVSDNSSQVIKFTVNR